MILPSSAPSTSTLPSKRSVSSFMWVKMSLRHSRLWSVVHQRRIAASPASTYRTPSSVVLSTALPIFYFRSYFASAILGRSPSTDWRWW